jgi:trimethylamine:corrinoid methyltransferase-like protein
LGVFVINPLKAEGDTFDTLIEFKDDISAVMVGCMPQMGVVSPIGIWGTFVIGLASTWGAWALVNAITGLEDMGFFCRPWPTHMKTMDIVYGGPEAAFGELVFRQLAQFYGWGEDDSYSYHSSAPLPDAQAGFQRGAYTLMAALNGDRSFRFGGLLGVDFVFSPEQLLLDLEGLEYVKRVAEGIEFSEEMFYMDAIREVGTSGSYMDHDSTLDDYKKHLWTPDLYVHEGVDQWMAMGAKTAFEKASAEIEKLIAKHDYHLPEDKEKQLDDLCEQAYKALLK